MKASGSMALRASLSGSASSTSMIRPCVVQGLVSGRVSSATEKHVEHVSSTSPAFSVCHRHLMSQERHCGQKGDPSKGSAREFVGRGSRGIL